MNRKEAIRLLIGALAVFALMVVVICTIAIMMPAKHTTKAQTYNLECVAGRSRNPLQECKE